MASISAGHADLWLRQGPDGAADVDPPGDRSGAAR